MLRETISNEWFTLLIVLSLCILAIAKYAFSKRFNDFLWLIGNSKYLKIYAREQKFIDRFDALLFFNLIISVSIFLYISYSTFVKSATFDVFIFLKILLAVGAIILIKILLERLIGSLFEIDAIIDSYIFQKTNYKNYIGIVLLPINILLIFVLQPKLSTIYVVLGLLFVINTLGFITSFKTHQKLILNNFFYFILYLCALEIAPYIILYKLFIDS